MPTWQQYTAQPQNGLMSKLGVTINRFPDDFMFQLTEEEKTDVVANCDHLANLKFSPHLPFAFTEHGALMAASVLNTERAVQVSVFVVRAFVKIRELVATHKELAAKLKKLEQTVGAHDQAIRELVQTIKKLMEPPLPKPKKRLDSKVGSLQKTWKLFSKTHQGIFNFYPLPEEHKKNSPIWMIPKGTKPFMKF